MKNNLIAVSIFLLIAIVLNGWLVLSKFSKEEQQEVDQKVESIPILPEKKLLTQSELGEYPGITDEELLKLMPKTNDGVTTSSIPVIIIGNEYYFSIKAIDKWLTDSELENFQ